MEAGLLAQKDILVKSLLSLSQCAATYSVSTVHTVCRINVNLLIKGSDISAGKDNGRSVSLCCTLSM